ncbi:inner membrane protein import complex subunit Tim54-domain-containing protein [Lasiosphaeria miniovina]|uniref:Mitochondrial import inner membrane translocase subunit TIM54 n=1 Tax=Lasiosphaeria miniovina TaxID=1954250 RepID=A0AA40AU39_9PEZI|nr:inner membrane protein import complex subunit Tim54-domain-containing protein [Lasiosphaeria miniovina]KAK0722019.1 inner membrane protein import complex subunit Tim54-domain-containing protein [Lasiosphaeria miniovina]
MADPTPTPTPTPAPPSVAKEAVPPPRNPALRMLGLPALPRKLPSRNWLIFWTLSTTITAAIIYDRREKKRAIARWRHAVEHLAKEPLPGNGLAEPRKLTIFLSSPPSDGLRVAQDHYTEYVKPILAASGLDWEFVQGRREGDVRAVMAERVRKVRRGWEGSAGPDSDRPPTDDEIVTAVRRSRGIEEYAGVRGDIVIGRHTWKDAPPEPELPLPEAATSESTLGEDEKPAEENPPVVQETKPKRPPQPKPYNTTNDYIAESLPLLTPNEFSPVAPVPEPHILGFLNTPTRMMRFFNRRKLADDIGRQVAAVCLCTYREFHEAAEHGSDETDAEKRYEQQKELAWEEKDWVKAVWKEDKPKAEGAAVDNDDGVTEKIRARPIVMDPRVAARMRRFDLLPEDGARVRRFVVPEEEVEGWTKGKLRQLYRWGVDKTRPKKLTPLDDSDVE